MTRSPKIADTLHTTLPDQRAARDQALFDRISAQYTRKDTYAPSRYARRTRLARTIAQIDLPCTASVLEIGCGAGFGAQYLKGAFGSYTGIDYSDELIAYANRLNAGPNARFEAADLYEWQPERSYDLIFAVGVLHHMADVPAAMAIMWSMLNPGGWLVVNEPQPANRLFHWLRRLRSHVDSAYSAEQEELSQQQLVDYFSVAGFVQIATQGQGLFSTPFAELTLRPELVAQPLSKLCCHVDTWLEKRAQACVRPLTWNLIASGQRICETRS